MKLKFLVFLIENFRGFAGIIEWFARINTEMPWLKYVLIVLFVLFLLSKAGDFFEKKQRLEQGGEHQRREISEEIKKQNIIQRENSIKHANITFIAIYFKFFQFKKNSNKEKTPNFTKLILSFFSEINLFKGSFVKPETEENKHYYFLKFNSQSDALDFIQNLKNSIEDFMPVLQSFGYDMSYKIAVDNRNDNISNQEITSCLGKILSLGDEFGIYTTSLFKEFYDRDTKNKIYLSFNPKGRYMINSETIELYHLEE